MLSLQRNQTICLFTPTSVTGIYLIASVAIFINCNDNDECIICLCYAHVRE